MNENNVSEVFRLSLVMEGGDLKIESKRLKGLRRATPGICIDHSRAKTYLYGGILDGGSRGHGLYEYDHASDEFDGEQVSAGQRTRTQCVVGVSRRHTRG
eukprot:GABW01000084.1.p1 GENE.GABW01000084.1~~GABW01000084.1.p1  ORF type:complete len:100 (+),score=17.63 GABW01000084.1:177-476(+)